MKVDRRVSIVAVAGAVALAASGVGVAQSLRGDSEEPVTGEPARRAGQAALDATGGGTVLEVERQDGDAAGAYEVEVRRPDGVEVEVHLDEGFRPVGSVVDDDRVEDSEPDDEDADRDD